MPPAGAVPAINEGLGDTVEPENQEVVEAGALEGTRPRRKGIYLLPNLMTTGCLFSGFYGIVAAIDKHFAAAGECFAHNLLHRQRQVGQRLMQPAAVCAFA